ncbi:hypothetical protein HYU06_07330 [Candidatus Woesearchaeota archaeon]|nr:hypothetical protein [Candidatus Woesearchaeota archaeon]
MAFSITIKKRFSPGNAKGKVILLTDVSSSGSAFNTGFQHVYSCHPSNSARAAAGDFKVLINQNASGAKEGFCYVTAETNLDDGEFTIIGR